MTRIPLALSIFAVLVVTFAAGWALHWLWVRLHSRRDAPDPRHEMAERLHDAEVAREAAELRLTEVEAASHRDAAEREAELAAAMDTIGVLRRQIAEWQAAYDALQGKDRGD